MVRGLRIDSQVDSQAGGHGTIFTDASGIVSSLTRLYGHPRTPVDSIPRLWEQGVGSSNLPVPTKYRQVRAHFSASQACSSARRSDQGYLRGTRERCGHLPYGVCAEAAQPYRDCYLWVGGLPPRATSARGSRSKSAKTSVRCFGPGWPGCLVAPLMLVESGVWLRGWR
jgi:hypothetical protein